MLLALQLTHVQYAETPFFIILDVLFGSKFKPGWILAGSDLINPSHNCWIVDRSTIRKDLVGSIIKQFTR
jgi:hypothetical protein